MHQKLIALRILLCFHLHLSEGLLSKANIVIGVVDSGIKRSWCYLLGVLQASPQTIKPLPLPDAASTPSSTDVVRATTVGLKVLCELPGVVSCPSVEARRVGLVGGGWMVVTLL